MERNIGFRSFDKSNCPDQILDALVPAYPAKKNTIVFFPVLRIILGLPGYGYRVMMPEKVCTGIKFPDFLHHEFAFDTKISTLRKYQFFNSYPFPPCIPIDPFRG